ncbi:hypothetical protein [Pseudonocardia phyllosphaerae]|uniref:hypothetical protein n=1 Tax=Pseudonocardia phyllosphaerae TaxID=3390502 RepID=UPI00397DD4FF
MSSFPSVENWAFVRWLRRRGVVIGLSLVLGIALVVSALAIGAESLDGWSQSVLIELGTAVLLVAPLTWAEGRIQRSLGELDATLKSSVSGLSAIRNILPAGHRRTAIFDDLLTAVVESAREGEFPVSQIRTLLDGDGENRTVALAAMVGNPSLADGSAIRRSIHRPGSGNEQFYALRAAEAAWSTHLTADQRKRILDAIADDRVRDWIEGDPPRQKIADRLPTMPVQT